jgi:hypothetical protein
MEIAAARGEVPVGMEETTWAEEISYTSTRFEL